MASGIERWLLRQQYCDPSSITGLFSLYWLRKYAMWQVVNLIVKFQSFYFKLVIYKILGFQKSYCYWSNFSEFSRGTSIVKGGNPDKKNYLRPCKAYNMP